MAQKKFTQLPTADPLDGTEIYAIVQGGVSKKVTGSSGSLWQGVWAFPAGVFPTSTKAGQQWYTDAEYTADDGFTYSEGTLLISKAAGTGTANFIKKQ